MQGVIFNIFLSLYSIVDYSQQHYFFQCLYISQDIYCIYARYYISDAYGIQSFLLIYSSITAAATVPNNTATVPAAFHFPPQRLKL